MPKMGSYSKVEVIQQGHYKQSLKFQSALDNPPSLGFALLKFNWFAIQDL